MSEHPEIRQLQEEVAKIKVWEDTVRRLNPCLSQNLTGPVFQKCTHFAHQDCLNEYLVSNESDFEKGEMRRMIGLDLNTFQCPLCKRPSNCLLPSLSLQELPPFK